MGNAISTGKDSRKSTEQLERGTEIDYGPVVCLDDRRLTELKSTDPTSIKHKSVVKGYDSKTVAQQIKQRQLAPFYEGSGGDADEDPSLPALQKKTHDPGGGGGRRKKKGIFALFALRKKREPAWLVDNIMYKSWLTSGLVECPICFLRYPRNTNWTTCCRQCLCTFCFLHLRQPPSGREITCPFCNATGFAVKYFPPDALSELGLREDGADGKDGQASIEEQLKQILKTSANPIESSGFTTKSVSIRIKPPPAPHLHARRASHGAYPTQYYARRPSYYGLPPPAGSESAASSSQYHRRRASAIYGASMAYPVYYNPFLQ